MLHNEVTILNKLGLHARASAKLTKLAGQFDSEVWITRNGCRVNAKSIMGVMTLAANKGAVLESKFRVKMKQPLWMLSLCSSTIYLTKKNELSIAWCRCF